MGEIRFVGTGETRGYPYLVCKKYIYYIMRNIDQAMMMRLGFFVNMIAKFTVNRNSGNICFLYV